jgi:hemerythrin-like metal-binding protein/PAS domain S-box-containing protein
MSPTSSQQFEIFPWDPSFATGIDVIDEQHKELVRILNNLAGALSSAAPESVLNKGFQELVDYAKYHFQTEEEVWAGYFSNSRMYEQHVRTHAGFGKKLQELVDSRGSKFVESLLQDLLGFLVHWLAFHIVDSDKRMAFAAFEVKAGKEIEEAFRISDQKMGGILQALINTILSMYDRLSTRTVELLKERSARQKAEAELARSEERWKTILAGGGDEVWELDLGSPENSAIDPDNLVTRLLGGSGQAGLENATIHPDDIEQVCVDLQRHIEGATPTFSNKHRTIRPSGQWAWMMTHGKVVQWDDLGRPLRLVGTHTDITERVLASLIFAHCEQAIFIADENQCIQSTNPAFHELTGLEPAEVVGKDFPELVSASSQSRSAGSLMNTLTNNGQWEGERWIPRKDGGEFCAFVSVKISPHLERGSGHYIGLMTDITAQKEADQAIRRNQKLDAVGQLTGGISHDFNNILAVIMGNLELVTDQLSSAPLRDRVGKVQQATQRAIDLTGKLLNFSRVGSPHSEVLIVNDVLRQMDGLIRKSITPGVAFNIHYCKDLWPIEVDRSDLENALLNLILNARDALDGAGEISVQVGNRDLDEEFCSKHQLGAGEYVELQVSDTGCGMSGGLTEKIFEPFFTTKDETKGTGLGLPMVFGFVQRSGGMIDMRSQVGKGSTFSLYLPRTHSQAQAPNPTADAERTETSGGETILVVDDEPELRDIAKVVLSQKGYQVLLASNGPEALELLQSNDSIALLVTDVVMPGGMAGDQLARKARAIKAEIKILLTSGFLIDPESADGAREFEMLEKPYRISTLVAKVGNLLAGA